MNLQILSTHMQMGATKCIIIIWIFCMTAYCYAATDSIDYETKVRVECGYTRYPALCVQTLAGKKNVDLLSALVNHTISHTNLPTSNFAILSSHFISREAQLARVAIDHCNVLIKMSLKRLNQAQKALQKFPRKQKADIQTWLSAVITYHETCKDSIEDLKLSNSFAKQIYTKMDLLQQMTSNTLALANRITQKPEKKATKSRRLLGYPDADIFPSWVSSNDRKLLQSNTIKANVVVAKDGSGNYKTVSEAISAATGGRFVIYVKAGTYSEKINTAKDGITLIGDGKYSTIITASGNVNKGSSLRGTATFSITGDGFIARDIGFENTAGTVGQQAIALTVSSDHAVLYRCSLTGNQDTLYAHSLRQFYRECDIYGTVDFIFGNAAAVFQSCNLVFRRPRSGGAFDVMLASGRSDPGQNTGFSVQNCKISAGESFPQNAYLGRPWKAYARSVVMQSNIDGKISGRGWIEWTGASGSTYKTLYYGEYGNMGSGAGTSGRITWPGYHILSTADASKFTVGNFIGGNIWLPSTGVTFVSGL